MRVGGALTGLLLLALLFAATASAGFEQVATFAEGEEHVTFPNSAAVNTTGAGGVATGTVYASGSAQSSGGSRSGAYLFGSKGEYLSEWVPVVKGELEKIAIYQATGYVYVLGSLEAHNVVRVFSADGSELIAAFGDHAAPGETIDQSPEKFHTNVHGAAAIAVDNAGTVYISDHGSVHAGEDRVMVWKPQSPGDYAHYVYTGQASDMSIAAYHLAIDDFGNIYTSGGKDVLKFAPGEPATPACRYEPPGLVVGAITVDAASGSVFFFNAKTSKLIHQLAPCSEGEFEEEGSFALTPKPGAEQGISALAFNPSPAWDVSRPAGILYGFLGADALGRGYIFAPAEIHFPVVESQWSAAVTATTATLNTAINPKGSRTHYAFQYETLTEYEANPPEERFAGAREAPLGGSSLPASQEAQSALASLVGLAPDAEYRYRAIAASHCNPEHEEEACEDTGEARGFHTYPLEAPGLPDHRAWELVSPPQKSGGEAFVLRPETGSALFCVASGECKPGNHAPHFPMLSSPDGEAVVYEGFPFSPEEGSSIFNSYISHRTETGWQTTILAPALMTNGNRQGYTAFDANLSKGILAQETPSLTPSAPSEYPNLYTQPTASPSSLTALLTEEPPNRASNGLQLRYAGASDDLSRIFFAANDALTPETPFAPEAVDGGSSKYNLYEWAGGQLRLVNVLPGNAETIPGAGFGRYGVNGGPGDLPQTISADGTRVFWSNEAGQLYVRIDGETTVEIPDAGKYLTASDDGSEVLLDDGHLYDLETEETTDLTEGQGGFQGIAGHSEDLSHIYFVDTAALTGEEQNDQGDKAQPGKANLYAWADGEIAFVATLFDLVFDNSGVPSDRGDWLVSEGSTAEASPDGRWLAFQSILPLTGYDNFGPTCFASAGLREYVATNCREAFLYDSATGQLACASCNPSASRPLGPTKLPAVKSEGTQTSYLPQPRYLTDSGRLYFDSQDALSPADTNRAFDTVNPVGEREEADGAGAEDVYGYEPQGVGTCEREGGCVHLLSAGHESGDSNFLAVDESGENVFFTTRDQLVQKDRDDLMDVYDAREFGGIPSETETARGECQGEACQPQVTPPNDPTPGSSAFEGAGNVVEEKAAKKHRKHHKHRHKAKRHRHKRAAKHNRGGVR